MFSLNFSSGYGSQGKVGHPLITESQVSLGKALNVKLLPVRHTSALHAISTAVAVCCKWKANCKTLNPLIM